MEMDDTCSQNTYEKMSLQLPSRENLEIGDERLRVTSPDDLYKINSALDRLTIRLPRKITNEEEYEQIINGLKANPFLSTLHIDLSNNWLEERQLLELFQAIGKLEQLKDLEISIEMTRISDASGVALAELIRNKRKLKKLILNIDSEGLSAATCKNIYTSAYVRANPIKRIAISGINS
jgi:hypothetical protein